MTTKICSKCEIEKAVCDFYNNKTRYDGKRPECKTCSNKSSILYNKKNKDSIVKIKKKYVDNNKEKVLESKQHWFDNNPNYKKEYYEKNIDKIKNNRKVNYYNNREEKIEYSKNYSKKNRKKVNEYVKIKRNTDPLFKLRANTRTRINIFLKSKNVKKYNKTIEIIGCSFDFLKEYLEKQFLPGMSWDNYGLYTWHIDHKIPLSSAKSKEEIYKLCHYTNLQPLWAEDNLRKQSKIIF